MNVFNEKQQKAYNLLLEARLFYYSSLEEFNQDVADDDHFGTPEDYQLAINLNDTFFWASADCEVIGLDELEEVARLFFKYGWSGILYWVVKKRDWQWHDPEFLDARRQILFVHEEESVVAGLTSSKAAYKSASYVITDEKPMEEQPATKRGWVSRLLQKVKR